MKGGRTNRSASSRPRKHASSRGPSGPSARDDEFRRSDDRGRLPAATTCHFESTHGIAEGRRLARHQDAANNAPGRMGALDQSTASFVNSAASAAGGQAGTSGSHRRAERRGNFFHRAAEAAARAGFLSAPPRGGRGGGGGGA